MDKCQKKVLRKSKEYMFDEDEESSYSFTNKRLKLKFLYFVFMSLSCSLALPPIFSLTSSISIFVVDEKEGLGSKSGEDGFHADASNDYIYCDRSSRRSDICVMKGDVRTDPPFSSLILYSYSSAAASSSPEVIQHEKIRPYTRKWEANTMDRVGELSLIAKRGTGDHHQCDVRHDVPAVVFSTSGYTGNLYHEFNDGIIPLYITSQNLNKNVVFVILEYHEWWITKYGNILSLLSHFPPIDFGEDERIYCFPEAIVGLRIHDELSINPALMEGNKTIIDFRDLLDRAYSSPTVDLLTQNPSKPKMIIIARNGSRRITNQESLVKLAEQIGFNVKVVYPVRTTKLAETYRELNSSDVMVGVHGAAMTHFLFMRPGSVFIQVIPLGTDWAARTYYEEPAVKLGLRYIGYKIMAKESSLSKQYKKDDPILMDPNSLSGKGWEFTKRIYLTHQTVRLDLTRFHETLLQAYNYAQARTLD